MMLQYVAKRIVFMVPTLLAISIVAFVVIQLPPGDFVTTYIATLAGMGESIDQSVVEAIKEQYGFDRPIYVQYWRWMSNILTRGDFGRSFESNRPVAELIWERLVLTVVLSLAALLVTWIIAFPIGVYSAVKQYSLGDYVFTFLGFVGLAVPSFLIALVLMYVAFRYFNITISGLFSFEFVDAPWSWARVVDMLRHIWVPMIVLSIGGTAGLIRVMRANLLDELHRPYVVTARAKGMSETRLLIEYPVRLALNPWISTVGFILPGLVSGAVIISVVLNLPMVGPLYLRALQAQDMFLAGGIMLMLSLLTIIGMLISDILLAWLDPRIRYQ